MKQWLSSLNLNMLLANNTLPIVVVVILHCIVKSAGKILLCLSFYVICVTIFL